ncbi:hypothetical protein GCM10009544_28090 [Streptomyces stramineus]|uniref:Uncharacterized protein n=1 Tax=Streptomyces stramineus TaxID=173861 RepID=A0ABP3JTR2_9ACTN
MGGVTDNDRKAMVDKLREVNRRSTGSDVGKNGVAIAGSAVAL